MEWNGDENRGFEEDERGKNKGRSKRREGGNLILRIPQNINILGLGGTFATTRISCMVFRF
jgi:hypothetical protein